MKDSDLWQAFLTEVSEQLDSLELILAASDAETSADIHQLFRDFHTIKSSCAMMDFHSMEKVAHASEDYLDLVRKGKTTLESSTINTLLSGIDWLKQQLQQMRNSGNAPQENIALVTQLQKMSEGYSLAATPEETEFTDSNTATHLSLFSSMQLSGDELHEFASACQEELVTGLTPDQEFTKVKRSLNKLVSICNLLGFTAISTLLRQYIKATNPLDQGLAASLAAEILHRITLFEKYFQVDCGTSTLHAAYFDAMFVNFTQLSGRLDYLFDLIEENPDSPTPINDCEILLKLLTINADLFGYSQLATLFRYLLQILRHIKRNEIPDRHAAFYAMRRAADISFANQSQAGETEASAQTLKNRIAELDDSIAQAMLGEISELSRQQLSTNISIPQNIFRQLSNSAIAQLNEAANNGKTIIEISIDAGCDNDSLEQAIALIEKSGTPVHSYSGSTNALIFIVILTKDTDTLNQDINKALPVKNYLSLKNLTVKKEYDTNSPHQKTTADIDKKTPSTSSATLRIESITLESLMTQSGELLMAHNALSHELKSTAIEDAITQGWKWLADHQSKSITAQDAETIQTILNTLQRAQKKIEHNQEKLRLSLDAMQNRILDLRVVPVSAVFNRIPQLVQKMADTQGKKIDLSIEGASVCIDKGMVDVLMEPLIHLVRNCIDHGIEHPEDRCATGKNEAASLVLSASQEGSTLLLEIADDGRGINLPKIRESAIRKGFIQEHDILTDQETCKLIFLPGFSTAEAVTETSGRGVGMDVVITRIQHIGGNIDVHTVPGFGTRFIMTLPLSAALQDVLMVQTGSHTYALAQSRVTEILSTNDGLIQTIMGQSALLLRDTIIPLFNLDDLVAQRGKLLSKDSPLLNFHHINENIDATILIIGQQKNKIAICVSAILGKEKVFVRDLHKDLRQSPSISGVTVRSNGELVFILNSYFLQQYAQNNALSRISNLEAI
ncbi:MAG: Hpt domain-containing protein [Pseudomonadales bacterium]